MKWDSKGQDFDGISDVIKGENLVLKYWIKVSKNGLI